MSEEKIRVEVDNDNSGCLFGIVAILFLIFLELASIGKTLKENFEPKTEPENVQTVEVQE